MMTAVFPLATRCWHFPSPGGGGGFSFGLSFSSTINGGNCSIYGVKGAKEKKEDPSSTPAADFSLYLRRRQCLRLLPLMEQQRPRAGYPLGMPPRRLWCLWLIRALSPRLRRQCRPSCLRWPPCLPLPSMPHDCFRLSIGHSLLICHQNVLNKWHKRQRIPNLCLTLSTTTLRMVGYIRYP